MTGFSTTVTTTSAPSRSMRTSANRPVANSALIERVDLAGVVGVADGELQIGADRLRLDAAIADDVDVLDHALSERSAWSQVASPIATIGEATASASDQAQ